MLETLDLTNDREYAQLLLYFEKPSELVAKTTSSWRPFNLFDTGLYKTEDVIHGYRL